MAAQREDENKLPRWFKKKNPRCPLPESHDKDIHACKSEAIINYEKIVNEWFTFYEYIILVPFAHLSMHAFSSHL